MLGNWEAAYKDFCKAQLSDFDEEVQIWCKEVAANVYRCLVIVQLQYYFSAQAKKISEHKRKYERRREDKEANAKRERIRKAQEAYAKAQQEENIKNEETVKGEDKNIQKDAKEEAPCQL